MVEYQLQARGITSPRVLEAFRRVPRHLFVHEAYHHAAYSDMPLPIPAGQTVSQPYIVAYMLQALRVQPDARVLEVGTGSGYAAALLGCLAERVYTIERHAELVTLARKNLALAGCENVVVLHGDGTLGWPEFAPYDGIVVAASGPSVPDALREQMALGGRLVMPVGDRPNDQYLMLVERLKVDEYVSDRIAAVRFVPLIGREGW